MAYDVVMPQLGMTMTEGTVVAWLKEPGDPVERGEPLFVVQTDKVDMDVEATAAGKLQEILLEPGNVVAVGTVIARILTPNSEGEMAPTVNSTAAQVQPAGLPVEETGVPSIPADRVLASPRARRLARELGVEIGIVSTARDGGRIVEADVTRYVESRTRGTGAEQVLPRMPAGDAETRIRSRIAERMTESFSTIPHFYLTVVADATELTKMREQLLDTAAKLGVRITLTDLLIKSLALALRENPQANVSWRDGGVVHGSAVHIGVAAQFGERLLVPVFRDADRLTVLEIARARTGFVERGRSNRLNPDDLHGASCTLSNLGMHRVDQFSAVINPPESSILAAGRIAPRPFVVDGNVVARETIGLTLSVDHRVIDGVAAARLNGTTPPPRGRRC